MAKNKQIETELNNSSKRKSVMKRLIEAIKSLSEEDKDFENEPVNKGEQAYFNACLANIKHPTDFKRDVNQQKDIEDYRNRLKTSRAKKNQEINRDDVGREDLNREIGDK